MLLLVTSIVASGGTFAMVVFGGTLVIGLILRSLWGLYKMYDTLWFYLVSL